MTVAPIADHRGRRSAPCRLCGLWPDAGLTKTHVPMRRSGNDGPIRPLVTRRDTADGTRALDYGRPSDGGMWGWWFCRACNTRTGRWDETYQQIWRHLLGSVHDPSHGAANQYRAHARIDAGAFARSIWAWAFALDDHLRVEVPDVAAAVVSGDPVDPPTGVVVGLALTRSLRMFVSSQRDVAAVTFDLRSGDSALEPTPRAVIAAPPFNVVVAGAHHRERLHHAEISGLLAHTAGDLVNLEFSLPIINVDAPDQPRGPATFASLTRV